MFNQSKRRAGQSGETEGGRHSRTSVAPNQQSGIPDKPKRMGQYIYIYIYRERERDRDTHTYTHTLLGIILYHTMSQYDIHTYILYIHNSYIYIYIYIFMLRAIRDQRMPPAVVHLLHDADPEAAVVLCVYIYIYMYTYV